MFGQTGQETAELLPRLRGRAASLVREAEQAEQKAQWWREQATRLRARADSVQTAVQVIEEELTEGDPGGRVLPSSGQHQPEALGTALGGQPQRSHNTPAPTFYEQIKDLIDAEPGRVWSAAEVSARLPHVRRKTIANTLQRLADRGVVERIQDGQYRVVGPAGRNAAPEQPAAVSSSGGTAADDRGVPGGGVAPVTQDGEVRKPFPGTPRFKILELLAQHDTRAWRPPEVAELLSESDTDYVRTTMARMVDYGELTKDPEGNYRLRRVNGVMPST